MDQLRSYALRIISTALICGLLPDLLHDGSRRELVKAVSGLVLALTVITPFRDVELVLPDFPELNADAFSAEGEQAYEDALEAIIKSETQAYILDKAAALGADIQVQVELSTGSAPVPVSAVFNGDIPKQIQSTLCELVQRELGIAKEDQVWIGEP